MLFYLPHLLFLKIMQIDGLGTERSISIFGIGKSIVCFMIT